MNGISDFKRINKIGQGAFGIAWLVESKTDFNKYVIKEIGLYKMNERERTEAKKEVSVLSKMNHPNIVSYLNSFEEAGCFHILMEYCEGGDLYRRIKAQNGIPFREDQVLDYFVQICLALKHIHDQKILHRDIKPQNIFLTKTNIVKLGDFGIAKVMNSTTALTKTTVGTPFYFSPEICEGKPYNNKSDIWSLGCILYELCSLNYAFYGQDMTILAMQIKRVNYNPVPTSFSSPLRALIDNMFRRRPDERPNINTILKKPFVLRKIDKFLPPESQLSIEVKNAAQKRPSTANVVSRVDSGLSNKKRNRIGRENVLVNSPYMPINIRNVQERKLPIKISKPEEVKQNIPIIKQQEALNRMKVDRINNDRENAWKNIMSSDDSKPDNKEGKLAVKPTNYMFPPPAIKHRVNSPAYDHYYAELDRINEQQKLRERDGRAMLQQMYRANENRPVNKIQNGVDGVYRKVDERNENNDFANFHAKRGPNAGDQALVIQEYLDRKQQAKNIKYRDGSGMALVLGGHKISEQLPTPRQVPGNIDEEIADRLNKIRQKNAEQKKDQNFEDQMKKYEIENNMNFNPLEARKAIEELQKKLKQRTEDLRQKLEKKDKEKVKENILPKEDNERMNVILFPKRNTPIIQDIPTNKPSPPPTEQSSISVILGKLHGDNTPVNDNIKKDQIDSVDPQPSLSVIFNQLEEKPSRPSTACNSEQSEIRKKKDIILKRLNEDRNIVLKEVNDVDVPVRKSWIYDMDEQQIYSEKDLDKTSEAISGNSTLVDVSLLNHDDNEKLRNKWKIENDFATDTLVLNQIKVLSDSENSEFDGSTITLNEPSVNVDLPSISESSGSINISSNHANLLSTIIEASQEITEINLNEFNKEKSNIIQREEVWKENGIREIKSEKADSDLLGEHKDSRINLQNDKDIICIDEEEISEDKDDQNDSDSSESDHDDLIERLKNVLSTNFSYSNDSNNSDDGNLKTPTNDIFDDSRKRSSVSSLNNISETNDAKIRRIKSDGELYKTCDKEWSLDNDTNACSSEDFGDEENEDDDNIFLKIERTRAELEKKIGIDMLIDAIEFVRENQDLNGTELANKLKQMIQEETSINDIVHLVVLEEQYHNVE